MQQSSLISNSTQNSFEHFTSIYKNPEKVIYESKEKNQKVIGCLGNDIPLELFISAKTVPLRALASSMVNFEDGDRYLESGFDPRIRAQLSSIVSQNANFFDRLIISNSSDALIRIYYYLRAIHYYEKNNFFPEPYFFDFLHSRSRICALYNRERVAELKKELESWTDFKITEEELRKSIELCNQTRSLIQQLDEFRSVNNLKLSGVKALQIITSSYLMERESYNQLLSTCIEEAEKLPLLDGVRIFMAGSTHEHDEFYQLVESCGTVIVGESHDYSSLFYQGEIDATIDPIDAITDFYHFRERLASQATVSERVASLVREVNRSQSEGVIFFIHKADDASLWDYPEQVKALKESGIPCLILENQPFYLEESEKIKHQINEFVKSIRKGEQ